MSAIFHAEFSTKCFRLVSQSWAKFITSSRCGSRLKLVIWHIDSPTYLYLLGWIKINFTNLTYFCKIKGEKRKEQEYTGRVAKKFA